LKASVASLDRLYRGIGHDPNRGTIAAKVATLALLSMGLYAVNRNNPLYAQLEDWDRDSNWHFFVPKPATLEAWSTGQPLPPLEERYWHLRFPKIWEIGAMSSIAERQLEGILNGQPLAAQKHMLSILYNVLSVNPIPQPLQPVMEQIANREF